FRTVPAGAEQVRLEAAKRLAAAAITRRVLALRELETAAKAIARLSDSDRSALSTQLQGQIDGLTSLNAKIQGDGDEATVRADAGAGPNGAADGPGRPGRRRRPRPPGHRRSEIRSRQSPCSIPPSPPSKERCPPGRSTPTPGSSSPAARASRRSTRRSSRWSSR